ncbi:MAG: hypothetical protein NTZ48_02700 [Candidatus Omnitrophica bacterium]|nr:hypothetical protein [Candidatus Omnitrophota bacterium]
MFQYQYPQLFIPLMFLSRKENIQTGGTSGTTPEDLNNFRNAITAMYNQQATAVQQSGNFRSYNYYLWSVAPSAAIPYRYIMDMSVPPTRTSPSYDGTTSANATAGSMQFAPLLSYEGLRYMALAFPQMQGEYGFKDSINHERNWVAPTYFSLGQGLQLMGTWNALFYGNDDGIDTPLELNMKDKYVLASLFNLGFSLDEQFVMGDYSNASDDIKVALTGLDTQFNALKNGKAEGEKTLASAFESAFRGTLSKADSDADFNYILNWFSNKETGKFTYTADGKLNPEISSDSINTNFALFPLFMKTVVERTKAGLGDILKEPDIAGKSGIELAQTYIDKVEAIRQAASKPDESAIFAFQRFLEVSDGYYAQAIDALKSVINGKIDTEDEVKAQALLFVTYKKTWQYDQQKQAFIDLADAVEGNLEFKDEAVDLIAQYFDKEILADYQSVWVAPQDKLSDGQKNSVKGDIVTALNAAHDYPDLNNLPQGVSMAAVLNNNKISLISFRENYFNQNVSLYPLDPQEAGEIGFYVTQLFLDKNAKEEDIIGLISDMAMLKPLIEASLGRELDLQGDKEDVALLSLAVSLGNRIKTESGLERLRDLSDAQFLEVAKTVSGRDNLGLADISAAIESVRSFELSQGVQDKVDENEFLRRYFVAEENTALKDTVKGIFSEQGLQLDERAADEWTQLITDILTKDNIDERIIARVVDELPKIELKSFSTALQDAGGVYVYKDEYFGDNSNLDLQDKNVLQVVKTALEIQTALSRIFVDISGSSDFDPGASALSVLDKLLVTRLTKVVLDSGKSIADLRLAEIKAILETKTSDVNTQKALFASIVTNMMDDNLRTGKSVTEGLEAEIARFLGSIPASDMNSLSIWIETRDSPR